MTDSNKSISLLRQRMTEDMTMRKLTIPIARQQHGILCDDPAVSSLGA
jgi:hypothetical protein